MINNGKTEVLRHPGQLLIIKRLNYSINISKRKVLAPYKYMNTTSNLQIDGTSQDAVQ